MMTKNVILEVVTMIVLMIGAGSFSGCSLDKGGVSDELFCDPDKAAVAPVGGGVAVDNTGPGDFQMEPPDDNYVVNASLSSEKKIKYYRYAYPSKIYVTADEPVTLVSVEDGADDAKIHGEETLVSAGESFVWSEGMLYISMDSDKTSVLTFTEYNADDVLVNEEEISVSDGNSIAIYGRSFYPDPTFDEEGNWIGHKQPANDSIDPPVNDAKLP